MRTQVVIGAALAALLLAGCGQGKSATGSASQTTAAHQVVASAGSSTSSGSSAAAAATTSASKPDPLTAAIGRLQDFVGSTKGLSGHLDYQEDDGAAGTLHLVGSFGYDQDFSRPPSGQLSLQAMVQTPVPVWIRAVDKDMYFREGSGAWAKVSGLDLSSPQSASHGQLAATLLGAITPSNWSGLVNAASSQRIVPAAAGGQTFRGKTEIFHALAIMAAYSPMVSVRIPQQWPDPIAFVITCSSTGQLKQATEVMHGANGSATITLTVTGYSSQPVAAP